MTFDIRAAVARLNRRDVEQSDSIYAIAQAVSQFNAFLTAAKKRYPESVDLQALFTFDNVNVVKPKILLDASQRLLDAFDVAPDDTDKDSPMLSQKFGIVRAESQLEVDFSGYLEDSGGLGLLFLDIDHFKKLNTKYTETVVDRDILVPFQHLLVDVTYSRGFSYSVGGDEFIILLRNVAPDEAVAFAHRLLTFVREHTFRIGTTDETLTLSIGVACYPHDARELLALREMANQAENTAKAKGRNQVVRATGQASRYRETRPPNPPLQPTAEKRGG